MRALGIRISPPLAHFIRSRAREFRRWPDESFMVAGGTLYVRAWTLETSKSLLRLSRGELKPDKMVDLKVWRPWWSIIPWLLPVGATISCEPYGRYGNRVVQAAAGFAAARVFRATRFLLRTEDFATKTKKVDLEGITFSAVNPLGGRVEVDSASVRRKLIIEGNWLLSQEAFCNRKQIIDSFRVLRQGGLVKPLQPPPPERPDFVMHFRGTDQLTRDWRPPPLSFYVASALHAQVSSVLIVSDDPKHRLLTKLRRMLSDCGINSKLQSSSLGQDIQTLLSAKTMCIGIGTFASSLAGLSRSLGTVYAWRQPDWKTWTTLRGNFDLRPDLLVYHVSDVSQSYVLPFEQGGDFSPPAVVKHVEDFPLESLRVNRDSGI
jgi:hypothetical protein